MLAMLRSLQKLNEVFELFIVNRAGKRRTLPKSKRRFTSIYAYKDQVSGH